MSSGVKGGTARKCRVTIPSGSKKTIESIKEITGQNHSEDEIYAMLKECSMDPNEAAQKLLLFDTFHEVKKKRDKRKENMNKELTESKWKAGTVAWANIAGRGNYQSRYISYESGSRRNLAPLKENATTPLLEKGTGKDSLAIGQEMKKNVLGGTSDIQNQQMVDSSSNTTHVPSSPALGPCFSFSDPIPLPSQDLPLHSAVGPIRRVVGSQRTPVELIVDNRTENSHISDTQHVIIPDHLQVPEAEKHRFCFGSFDACIGLDTNLKGISVSNKSPSESEACDKPVKELQLSNQKVLVDAEDTETKFPEQPQSPSQGPENFPSIEVEVSASITSDSSDSKQEVSYGTHQHDVVHTSSNFNVSFMQSEPNGQHTPSETSESQVADDFRIPRFFLQGGAPPILPTAYPLPLMTQADSIMQQSSTPPQQPLPVFQQPNGLHLPHNPPIFIMPYGPYFIPFYLPPLAFHQFITNGAFPQQPHAGNLYPIPAPPGTTAENPVSQLKQGLDIGNPNYIGFHPSYPPCGLSMANNAAVTSTADENLAAPQEKENNNYVHGTQSEGTGVWFITPPNRDISTLQANSFHNHPQGQLAFNPTQPGHGTFTGIFHPAQVATFHPHMQRSQSIKTAADMVGPTPSVYNI